MAEDRRADRPRQKSHCINAKRFERTGERIGAREVQPCKHQARNGAVQEEVVPLDRRTDRAGQHRAAKLSPVLRIADRIGVLTCGHAASLRRLVSIPAQLRGVILDFGHIPRTGGGAVTRFLSTHPSQLAESACGPRPRLLYPD